MTLMRDVQGSAAEKLAMFEKVRGLLVASRTSIRRLAEAERILREFVAMEKERE